MFALPGLEEDSDNESEAEYGHDDKSWSPHGSKAVGSSMFDSVTFF